MLPGHPGHLTSRNLLWPAGWALQALGDALSPSPQGRDPWNLAADPLSPSLGCSPVLAQPLDPWKERLQAEPSTSQGFKHTCHLRGSPQFLQLYNGRCGERLFVETVVCQALVTHTHRLGGGHFDCSHFTGEEAEGWVAFAESHNQEWQSWSGWSCRSTPL